MRFAWKRLRCTCLMLIAVASGVAPGGPAAATFEALAPTPQYTCPMHPQIREDQTGVCPICGMHLVPVAMAFGEAGEISLSAQQERILDVLTAAARMRTLYRAVRTVAEVTYDERNLVEVTARVNGSVDAYFNFFNGDIVNKGDTLVELHSPELIRVEEDYVQGLKATSWIDRLGSDMPNLDVTSRVTLLWRGIDETQLNQLREIGSVPKTLSIKAPITGVVIEQRVNHNTLVNAGVQGGQFTAVGDAVVKLADISTMWIQARLLGADMELVKERQLARVKVLGLDDRVFEAPVSYVYPDVDLAGRARLARVVVPNDGMRLLPGMYADVTFLVPVREGLDARTADVHVSHAGAHGGADLPTASIEQAAPVLAVPRSAVIDTGEARYVFVKTGEYRYQYRRVRTGRPAGDWYPVLAGLHVDEPVVVQGQFFLQAEVEMRASRTTGHTHPADVSAPAGASDDDHHHAR